MSAVATLSDTQIPVEPGSETSTTVTVRNTGEVVEEFRIEVIGDMEAWASVSPPSISLFPGDEETVTVNFRPPRDHKIPAGPMPFAVKVIPSEDGWDAVVEEGVVEIAAFHALSAELMPRTSRGRRKGQHSLAIDNRGNRVVQAELDAAEADDQLLFELDPPKVDVAPGQAVFAKVVVKPDERFWRGPPKTMPFQIVVIPEDDVPIAVDGTFLNEPRVPAWLPRALLLLLLLLILLTVLWFTLIKPTIESTARQVAEEELEEIREEQAQLADDVAAAQESAEAASEEAAAASAAAEEAEERAEAAETGAGDVSRALIDARQLEDTADFRLSRNVSTGSEGTVSFTVPDDTTFALTDIVLQNPRADEGTMQVRRSVAGTSQTLIEVELANFRDLDYHFVSPVIFEEGEQIVLFVSCTREEGSCTSSAYFTGLTSDLSAAAEEQFQQTN